MEHQRWQDWITALIGLWVFVTPFAMPALSGGPAMEAIASFNHFIVGVAVFVVGVAAAFAYKVWEEWVGMVLGLWLMLSPWLLGFGGMTGYMLNALIAGAIIVVLAGWAAFSEPERASPCKGPAAIRTGAWRPTWAGYTGRPHPTCAR